MMLIVATWDLKRGRRRERLNPPEEEAGTSNSTP